MPASATSHLIDRLPKPRGRLTADAPLGAQTWFRTGGNAEVLFRPADTEDLASFLAALAADVRVTVLGVGSNVLVRDGGIRGVVIRLMRGFTGITVEGNEVIAGAGAPDLNVALTARDHALAGLEFLSSAGIRVLMLAAKRTRPAGIRLALCALRDNIAEVFEISGITGVFAIHPDRAGALASLR